MTIVESCAETRAAYAVPFACAMRTSVLVISQPHGKIVALPFGFGSVDDADRSLQARLAQPAHKVRWSIAQAQVEVGDAHLMEERFVAVGQTRPSGAAEIRVKIGHKLRACGAPCWLGAGSGRLDFLYAGFVKMNAAPWTFPIIL